MLPGEYPLMHLKIYLQSKRPLSYEHIQFNIDGYHSIFKEKKQVICGLNRMYPKEDHNEAH